MGDSILLTNLVVLRSVWSSYRGEQGTRIHTKSKGTVLQRSNLTHLMANRSRLPPDVNRIMFVKNLPFAINADEMYAIFGKYGSIAQIRVGDAKDTKGTAFVVYHDIYDAQAAFNTLNGFNVLGRYIVVRYHNPRRGAVATVE